MIRNALFNLPARVDYKAVPWVIYTDPELAHVGLSDAAAGEQGLDIAATSFPFAENDRARAEHATEGFIKVVTGKRGRILGATIVGRHAGELILPWVLATQKGLKMSDMASIIAPYPTLGEVSRRVAGAYFTPSLFSPAAPGNWSVSCGTCRNHRRNSINECPVRICRTQQRRRKAAKVSAARRDRRRHGGLLRSGP